MKINLKKYVNIRLLIVIACIVIFILINSAQESYFGVNDYPISELTTISYSTPTGTTQPSTTEPYTPSTPTNTPTIPPNNPQGGSEALIPAQVIPIAIAIAIIIIIAFLLLRKRTEGVRSVPSETISGGVIEARREKFRTKIKTLTETLREFLKEGDYTEGIIFGFHQLDENMKKILGIKRESYLTPKEFAGSLDLPKILPSLESVIQTFYLARYKNEKMKRKDLIRFIDDLEEIKRLSETHSDIEIIQRISEENSE